ncbi:MAG: hypothetical protein OXC14_17190 [Rhodospirillaceae bacterium]|nr:hypothetical protein [Rhodospirillaceae bacterium]
MVYTSPPAVATPSPECHWTAGCRHSLAGLIGIVLVAPALFAETVAGAVRKDLAEPGLAGNAVEDLGSIAGLDGLRRLDLRGNSVRDLRPLRGLPSLVWVHVGGSRIEGMAPLDGLDGPTAAGRNDLEPPSPGNGRARRFASEGDAGR